MLILTRKVKDGQDEIIIGDMDVVFTLLSIKGSQIRIGVKTKDPNVSIHRGEVFNRLGLLGTGGKKRF